jgi:hypothetical protein
MKAIETFGRFDEEGNFILEDKPLIKNKRVKLLILLDEEGDNDFQLLSAEGLNNAYSDDEPTYNLSSLNEPNTDYAGR